MDIKLEKLKLVVARTTSKNSCYREYFNKSPTTGKLLKLLEIIKQNNISTNHWYNNRRGEPRKGRNKLSLKEVFKEDSSYSGITIKRILRSEKLIPFICQECEIGEEWNNKPLSLQIDHINGNRRDNRLENLRILCPNCHTQTETWGTKNFKRKIPSDEVLLKMAETMTNKEIAKELGVSCSHISKTIGKYFKKEDEYND